MNISQNGIAFLKQEEGFIAVPKIDTDKLCWGYGHNRIGTEVVPRSITVPQAETLLQSDLVAHVASVNKLAPWANQNQFDALVSFAFNAGMVRCHKCCPMAGRAYRRNCLDGFMCVSEAR